LNKKQKDPNMPQQEITPIQFMGIIFAIVFEFLGFLLFFGIVGYLVQKKLFDDNPMVLTISIFIGMMVGIYYMYNRTKNISKIRIAKLKKESMNQVFFNREKETKERIEKTKKEIKDYTKKMDQYFKKNDQ
jgi:F0F1-type ATP synthase assembly protein I